VQASDLKSTTRLLKAVADVAYEARDYPLLNSSISTLSKKHGQLKGAIQAMVEQTIGWLDEIRDRDGTEKWLELIETLRQVTEGKVYISFYQNNMTLETKTALIFSLFSDLSRDSPCARYTHALAIS
jgi:26S proteasome regulatory subunit N5